MYQDSSFIPCSLNDCKNRKLPISQGFKDENIVSIEDNIFFNNFVIYTEIIETIKNI